MSKVEGRTEYRIIIAGSRTFADYKPAEKTLYNILNEKVLPNFDTDLTEIVSGGAMGADKIGEKFGYDHNITVRVFPANWTLHGKRAGFIRNEEMAIYAADKDYEGVLIAFWDGISKGTENMINLAKRYGLRVFVVDFEGNITE